MERARVREMGAAVLEHFVSCLACSRDSSPRSNRHTLLGLRDSPKNHGVAEAGPGPGVYQWLFVECMNE